MSLTSGGRDKEVPIHPTRQGGREQRSDLALAPLQGMIERGLSFLIMHIHKALTAAPWGSGLSLR